MVDERRLSVKDLSIAFVDAEGKRNEVVKSISFDINANETLALVGESGSGKSVTALAITKLLAKNRTEITGQIKLLNHDILKMSEEEMMEIRGSDIGVIFQEPLTALNPLHAIGKQIGEAVSVHNPWMKPAAVKMKVKELLKAVELDKLTDRLDSFPHQLSGGQRQRVMIAIAIANNPKLLIADEPTTAIDARVSKQIMELLKKIKKEYNLSILFITHDLAMVKEYAETLVVMRKGEIVESGQTLKIFKNPKSEYTKFLINSEPKRLVSKIDSKAENVLEVRDLAVEVANSYSMLSFGRDNKKILEDVSFDLKKGETLGIIGESGSGKTTIAMAVLRLMKSSGIIKLNGTKISDLSNRQLKPYRKSIQVVFQDPFESLNPRMTIKEIIAEGPKAHHLFTDSELEERLVQSMKEVELDESYLSRYPHELSGGQRQRVAIARAIILNPEIVILDEPTSALDKAVQKTVLSLLKNLQDKFGLSYILISHDLNVINALSHRIAIIENGKIKEIGNCEDLIKKIA